MTGRISIFALCAVAAIGSALMASVTPVAAQNESFPNVTICTGQWDNGNSADILYNYKYHRFVGYHFNGVKYLPGATSPDHQEFGDGDFSVKLDRVPAAGERLTANYSSHRGMTSGTFTCR